MIINTWLRRDLAFRIIVPLQSSKCSVFDDADGSKGAIMLFLLHEGVPRIAWQISTAKWVAIESSRVIECSIDYGARSPESFLHPSTPRCICNLQS